MVLWLGSHIDTFHDNRTKSVVFRAVFRRWADGSGLQFPGDFPHPRGYSPAQSPGAQRINADPRSAFRLSPQAEPAARIVQAGFASGRGHGRVWCDANCQRTFRIPAETKNKQARRRTGDVGPASVRGGERPMSRASGPGSLATASSAVRNVSRTRGETHCSDPCREGLIRSRATRGFASPGNK